MRNMKTILIALLCLIPLLSFGADANQMKYVQILAPVASVATTSDAVSVAAYKGNATLAAQFSASSLASTATVTFAHSATSGGTYVTLTNLAGTACIITQTGPATNDVQTVAIDMARVHPYVKAIVAQTGDTNTVSALLIAPMKSE